MKKEMMLEDFLRGGDKASKRPFLEISSFARYYIFDFFLGKG